MSAVRARIDYESFREIAPDAHAALLELGKCVDSSGLDKGLTEIVKLRASQINQCAFCIQYHLNVARKAGVSPAKLDLVAAWADAGIFSERERAALAWTEALTGLTGRGVSEASYANVSTQFTQTELVFLTTAIAAINSWNRLGVAFRFLPLIPNRGAEE